MKTSLKAKPIYFFDRQTAYPGFAVHQNKEQGGELLVLVNCKPKDDHIDSLRGLEAYPCCTWEHPYRVLHTRQNRIMPICPKPTDVEPITDEIRRRFGFAAK
ncbi:hypothetical protein H6G89_05590 [Oscillatoria sp. FACHB-1407]|uniref:hypothetical protein n=1 Tax=Oscillatoria sp. FACHB-1407 TaxID=2692847 RepID=UPI001684DBD0|nr:hypothetical protein [Oscillatoria sp. FACHB-1407]MBD2460513.1 hypothetical protein [Oscillatoria sp. FACHB-1407]